MLAAITCQFRRAGLREVVIQIPDLAGSGNLEAAQYIEQGGLTAPRWPEQDHKFTRKEVEIHAAQRMDFHVSHTVGLGDPPNVKDWVGAICPTWPPRQIPSDWTSVDHDVMLRPRGAISSTLFHHRPISPGGT